MPPDTTTSDMASTSPAAEDGNVQQQASPFLRIAAELRNRIYEEAFSTTVTLTPTSTTSLESGYGIILACKQTCDEATGLYYGSHTFHFCGGEGQLLQIRPRCDDWLAAIGSKRRTMLKRVELDLAQEDRVHYAGFLAAGGTQDLSLVHFDATYAAIQIKHLSLWRSLRDGVAVVSIITPLSIAEDGTCSTVYTTTPEKTLEKHKEIAQAGKFAL